MEYKLNLNERGIEYIDISKDTVPALESKEAESYEFFDLSYRSLCSVMFNHAASGHPGGSVSSGRIVEQLIFDQMNYDFSIPHERRADIISYAAGHKALGLYAMWACRNEVVKQSHSDLLPEVVHQLRLEDLLGFRKNPITKTPLFQEFNAKPLDGHPTPQTPFVWLSTGPSGVGVTASVGLALALKDVHGKNAPRVHVIEGEGGLTPGRVAEAMASAATSGLNNLFLHIDWNQASIDSNAVTREDGKAGDYVQWDPCEFCLMQGFNVIYVPEGFDFAQIRAAQKKALALKTSRPTAIVYRTVKGWKYGIEGCKSHGAGHKFYSEEYLKSLEPYETKLGIKFPRFEGDKTPETIEKAFYDSLLTLRKGFEKNAELTQVMGDKVASCVKSFKASTPSLREGAPTLDVLYNTKEISVEHRPKECTYEVGSTQTLRGALANVLHVVNQKTHGAVFAAAADLYGSTNTSGISAGMGEGFWHPESNPESRLFSAGGIAEDAMGGICSGISTMGHHMGVGASYGAFIAPLNAICAKTHGIGQTTLKHRVKNAQCNTFISICGHAGVKTGEDGPTHAEPHALQMLQENYPKGVIMSLTPWDPNELWPLTIATLHKRPPVIAPFVTRPGEKIYDRKALGLAPAESCTTGVYKLMEANGKADGTVIYQGSDVAYVFVEQVLPKLKEKGINLDVYYVACSELFDLLSKKEREEIYPEAAARSAMMISGFTRPTTYRWTMSEKGREATLWPWKDGHYLGSGPGAICIEEAGLHGQAQLKAIESFIK